MRSHATFVLFATAATIACVQPRMAAAQGDQPSASTGGLEEIVVTARRKAEKAQSVPIAITAFSQQDLEEKHITQAADLIKVVPSFMGEQIRSDGNAFYSSQFRLRGLQGTEIYFADVPLGSTDYNATTGLTHATATGFFYDLDNLEILKGPQGTLFGKNSIGGLISIEPKKPTNNFEGYIQLKLGNYNDREFEGAVNIPIVQDKLLVRIAGQGQQRDGYTKDISNGNYYDDRNYVAWRVGVEFRPTDDFDNYLLYDGYYQRSNGTSTTLAYLNPGFVLGAIPVGAGTVPLTLGNGPLFTNLFNPAAAAATAAAALQAGAVSFFPTIKQLFAQQQALGPRAVTGIAIPNIGRDYFYGITDTATWNVTDDVLIKNIVGARIFKQQSTFDDVGIALPVLDLGNPAGDNRWNDNSVQYTEEFQIQGKSLNDKLSWVVGAFLEFDHPLGETSAPSLTLGNISYYHYNLSSRSEAAFAHGIYDLDDYVPGLRFTAGYRYTWDFVSVQEHGYNGVDAVTRNPNGTPSNCAPILFDNNCAAGGSDHYSSFGWNLSLDEQLTPDTLIYVRSGNAYRPGGLNPQAPAAFQPIKPEHVTDVEIGVKSDFTLFGTRLRTNADLFHTDYKAIQVPQLIQVRDSQGNPHATDIDTNAAAGTLEGGEIEVTALLLPGLEISPHASYLYTHYDRYPLVFGATEVPPFFFDPKWQFGVTGSYHLPLDESVGDVSVSATYSFEGQQYIAPPGGDIFPIIPSHDTLDLRVDWRNVYGQPFDLAFFMTNATDATFPQAGSPVYQELGFTSLTYNEPRMFGFSLKYRFGPPTAEAPPVTAYTPPAVQAPAPAPKSYLVFFDFNKSDLTPQAVTIVDQAAHNAGPAKVTQLQVTGHTDTVGSDAYNMRLSRRRAESVAAQLEKDGIPSSEIEIVAKGKRDLLVPTADGVKEPQNRRVQILYQGQA
jgi:iron complex outermembrane receptor protein